MTSSFNRQRDFLQGRHLSGGNKNRAATLLGLKRTTFVEMLKRKSLDAGEAPGPVS